MALERMTQAFPALGLLGESIMIWGGCEISSLDLAVIYKDSLPPLRTKLSIHIILILSINLQSSNTSIPKLSNHV
jgi:hypothetical protein